MRTLIDDTILKSKPVMAKIAHKFTTDPYEREELVQETYIRSLTSIDKFIDHPKLIPWLYVIMKNIYINKYRRVSIHRKAEKELILNNAMEPTTSNHAESSFVIKDIGSQMGIKEGTIKTRIHTIRKELKKKLRIYQ
jgi:RNA polymerase sigma factor (sigma-70 family)